MSDRVTNLIQKLLEAVSEEYDSEVKVQACYGLTAIVEQQARSEQHQRILEQALRDSNGVGFNA